MKIHRSIYSIFCALMLFSLLFQSGVEAGTSELEHYLPGNEDVSGWKQAVEPEIFEGEDLFFYINGGAELYYEYGFKQVITCEYTDASSNGIIVDIYEMEDAQSAYGVYTLTRGSGAEVVRIGQEGDLSGYYLLFWKGPFFSTVTGLDSGEDVKNGILAFAKSIDQKITILGQPPDLLQHLVHKDKQPSSVTYIQGPLGLMNAYAFHADDIFGVTEGIIGNFEGYSVFILKYSDPAESQKWYTNALALLKEDETFTGFASEEQSFSLQDSFQQVIYFEHIQQYILVVVGVESVDAGKQIANHFLDQDLQD